MITVIEECGICEVSDVPCILYDGIFYCENCEAIDYDVGDRYSEDYKEDRD